MRGAQERLAGRRFGKLLVIGRSRNKSPWGALWVVRCDCTRVVEKLARRLVTDGQTDCGCEFSAKISAAKRTHGHTRGKRISAEYLCWVEMIRRCYDPKRPGFRHYGARGITVCQRWRDSFEAFYADMGPKVRRELSIDRINNDGNYEPGNCRWATALQQAANKRPRGPGHCSACGETGHHRTTCASRAA